MRAVNIASFANPLAWFSKTLNWGKKKKREKREEGKEKERGGVGSDLLPATSLINWPCCAASVREEEKERASRFSTKGNPPSCIHALVALT